MTEIIIVISCLRCWLCLKQLANLFDPTTTTETTATEPKETFREKQLAAEQIDFVGEIIISDKEISTFSLPYSYRKRELSQSCSHPSDPLDREIEIERKEQCSDTTSLHTTTNNNQI